MKNMKITENNGMILAEVYNYKTPDYQDKPKRIGF